MIRYIPPRTKQRYRLYRKYYMGQLNPKSSKQIVLMLIRTRFLLHLCFGVLLITASLDTIYNLGANCPLGLDSLAACCILLAFYDGLEGP